MGWGIGAGRGMGAAGMTGVTVAAGVDDEPIALSAGAATASTTSIFALLSRRAVVAPPEMVGSLRALGAASGLRSHSASFARVAPYRMPTVFAFACCCRGVYALRVGWA